ncbi:5062_t:CDS:2 [Funneliformis caledonium]|uniref:5062_t:CDS:1 n=1 Tax=Funneliformis caledonium TaxID=1117310 RepID=A0A9N9AB71_9GLOM|nr:5062_t:CDS:2 [Funneliformis caledonium]
MEETFERIRAQINSKLDNQKQIAITLLAIEETIKEQNAILSPTSYFAALLTTLEQQQTRSEENVIGSILYLLNIVLKETPSTILKSKYSTILLVLNDSLELRKNDSAIIRSIIGCLENLLIVQEIIIWQQIQTKKNFQNILLLSLDHRPKPRKRVHDAIKKILSSIISSNGGKAGPNKHPAIIMTMEFCTKVLKEYIKTDQTSVIYILNLLKGIINIWPIDNLYSLCEILIFIPKCNQKYLTISSFQLFEELFQNNSKGFILEEHQKGGEGVVEHHNDRFKELLVALMDLMPNVKDPQLLPQWLMIITRGFPIYVECNKGESEKMLQEFFIRIFGTLESDNSDIIINATLCLCELISSGITDDMIQQTLNDKDQRRGCLNVIISTVEGGFIIKYKNSWPGILEISKSLFQRLHRSSRKLLVNLLKIVTDVRMDQSFELKEEADAVIGFAIENMGPRYLLNILPLNLESPGIKNHTGRAWLLPLLKDHIVNSELEYFLKEFLPLSQRLQQKSLEFQQQNRLIESKIYDTLVQQIWSLLPGFCNLPTDLQKNFNKSLGELLSNNMYQKPDLRPTISLALQNLVEKNKLLLDSEKNDQELKKLYGIDKNDAKKNLELLTKFSNNYLAVFFNVYSQTSPAYRGYLLEVIKIYLTITPAKDITTTFAKVLTGLFSQEDSTLQKKSYKIMNSLAETENGKIMILNHIEDLQIKLRNSTMNSNSASKKDRLLTLINVIKLLPSSDLHMIPDVLSEVILSTKEVNEKARINAYECLIMMGNKMKQGGTIIMTGLAATTPHMISATITSLSRLLFEFKNDLDKDSIHKLIDTMNNFINCPNREIVKAALGFVKVTTISLDVDILTPHLSQIILGILSWSNEHKSHFKVKVRHIFERLIRRFGYDTIEQHVPESDKKLLVNIKKRRERAKRKKVATETRKRSTFNSAYEDALYGSESELEDTDDENEVGGIINKSGEIKKKKNKESSKKRKDGSWIREGGDESGDDAPVDFLDRGIISKVIGLNPSNTRKQRKDFSKAFKETRDGKMIINESDDSEDEGANSSDVMMQEADNHFLEAQKSGDGFIRGQRNKIKFKKGNKKNDDMDLDNIEPIDAIASRNQKRKNTIKNTNKVITIGKAYKAKNAGGDIKKKGQPDPFAYIPLSTMYRKHNQKGPKISVTSKSKIQKRR